MANLSLNTIVLTRLLSNTCCPTAMGEEIQEWQHLWGAKVKMPIDVPDDILKAGITTVISKLDVRASDVHPSPRCLVLSLLSL